MKNRRGVKIGVNYGFSGVKRWQSQYLQGIKFLKYSFFTFLLCLPN